MVRHILLDLDNTLYSAGYGLEDNCFCRIQEFAASFLGMRLEECAPVRKEAMKRYGTTLGWLCTDYSAAKGYCSTKMTFTKTTRTRR